MDHEKAIRINALAVDERDFFEEHFADCPLTNSTGSWNAGAIASFDMRTTVISYLRSQRASGATGDGEGYAIHHGKAQARGK
jgi:hypothetical protein